MHIFLFKSLCLVNQIQTGQQSVYFHIAHLIHAPYDAYRDGIGRVRDYSRSSMDRDDNRSMTMDDSDDEDVRSMSIVVLHRSTANRTVVDIRRSSIELSTER